MAFCYFDTEAEKEGFVMLDPLFIEHYLPLAGEAELKVYLFGLDLCRKTAENVSLSRFAEDLNLSEKEARDAFAYWEKQGLLRVFEEPFSVKYLSVRSRFGLTRTFKKQKYADFNRQVEEIFEGRAVTPQEFTEYYTIIEDGKLEPDAMLLIIRYSVSYCGKDNPVRYIRKVANSWVEAGVRTVRDAEDRLMKEDAASQDVRAGLGALGRTSSPDPTDRQLYVKWSTKLGFSKDAVLAAAKLAKRKGGMAKLDEILENFAKKGIYTAVDIKEEVKRRDDLLDLAVRVNNKLGLYYQDLNAVIDNYAAKWVAEGFSAESLVLIAERCFFDDCRTLSAMDREVQEYFALGYVSDEAVRGRLRDLKNADGFMEKIVRMTGGARKVRESDRALYKNWLSWGFDENAITQAATLAAGKPYATAYMNQILSNWKSAGKISIGGEVAAAAETRGIDVSGLTEEAREKKLRTDKDYASYEKERRKLSIEIAKVISEGEIPSAEKTRRYDELEKLIAKRKEELGAE